MQRVRQRPNKIGLWCIHRRRLARHFLIANQSSSHLLRVWKSQLGRFVYDLAVILSPWAINRYRFMLMRLLMWSPRMTRIMRHSVDQHVDQTHTERKRRLRDVNNRQALKGIWNIVFLLIKHEFGRKLAALLNTIKRPNNFIVNLQIELIIRLERKHYQPISIIIITRPCTRSTLWLSHWRHLKRRRVEESESCGAHQDAVHGCTLCGRNYYHDSYEAHQFEIAQRRTEPRNALECIINHIWAAEKNHEIRQHRQWWPHEC